MRVSAAGRTLSSFAVFQPCAEGQLQQLPGGLALQALRSRHAETCYGLLLYWHGKPVLGWTVRLHTHCAAVGCAKHLAASVVAVFQYALHYTAAEAPAFNVVHREAVILGPLL